MLPGTMLRRIYEYRDCSCYGCCFLISVSQSAKIVRRGDHQNCCDWWDCWRLALFKACLAEIYVRTADNGRSGTPTLTPT